MTVRTPRGLAFSTAFRLLALLALLCAASTCAWPDRKVDEDASPEAEPSVKERAWYGTRRCRQRGAVQPKAGLQR